MNLRLYLSTEVENVMDVLQWWYEKCKTYPRLHRMALDYLSIPGMLFSCYLRAIYSLNYIATSVEVEWLFSCRRLVLSHTQSRLSVASMRALLCLGSWSRLGLVRDEDLEAVVNLNEVEGVMELNKLSAILRAKLE